MAAAGAGQHDGPTVSRIVLGTQLRRLREAAGITNVVVPECLYDDGVYDKWGNPVLPDGTRLPGPGPSRTSAD